MKKFKYFIIYFILLHPLFSKNNIDNTRLFENNFRVVNYSYEQGLSQSVVVQMAQDNKGYLWIATQSGLNRFDGLNFKVYKANQEDSNSLPYSFLQSIYFDGHNKLWLGSDNGLSYFDTIKEKFVTPDSLFDGIKHERITYIYKAFDENMWLIGEHALWLFNTQNFKVNKITIKDFNTKYIDVLTNDDNGNVWVLIDKKLVHVNRENLINNNYEKYDVIARNLNTCINISYLDNKVWISCAGKLLTYQLDSNKLVEEKVTDNTNVLYGEIVKNANKYWLSSDQGIWVKGLNSNNWEHFAANPLLNNALQTNIISTLFVGENSLLWLGTFGAGLSMWNPKSQYISYYLNSFQLSEYTRNSNFWKADVTDIALDAKENVWVSTRSAGLFKLDSSGKVLDLIRTENKKITTDVINSVFVDSKDRVWITTEYQGLFIKDGNDKWQSIAIDAPNNFVRIIIRISQDSKGRIFFSTFKGLFLFDEKTHKIKSLMDVFPDDFKKISMRVSKVFQASDGYYWIATDGGVVVLDPELKFFAWFNSEIAKLPLSHREANDIAEDKFGNIWVATGAGVDKINFLEHKWSVQSYNNIDLLKGKNFYTIIADNNGLIWIAGSSGLYQLDPTSEEVNKIPQKYGLQSAEFNTNAGAKDRGGRLYFGGINGLNVVEPKKLIIDYSASSIVNSEFIVDGKKIRKNPITKHFEFNDTSKYIRLEFDVIDLANAENIELRMRIPQLSGAWSPWTVERFFNLFDLSSGSYDVELQSRVSGKNNILNATNFSFTVNSSITYVDYLFWFLGLIILLLLSGYIRWHYRKWNRQKLSLLNVQIKLSEELNTYKMQLTEQKDENHQLLDELSVTFKDKDLLERQLQDLHLVDKQTGLHTRDFIKYSIDNAIRQFVNIVEKDEQSTTEDSMYNPQLRFLIIKLDGFESLRLQGGQFLLNQIIIQIAAEMKNEGGAADELVRWNQDSFLLYARVDKEQTLEQLCEKLCALLRVGEFGPSSSEQISMSCSIAAIEFPFNADQRQELDWPKLIELVESAAQWLTDASGDAWLTIKSRQKADNSVLVKQGIADFNAALVKGLFDIASSKNISKLIKKEKKN